MAESDSTTNSESTAPAAASSTPTGAPGSAPPPPVLKDTPNEGPVLKTDARKVIVPKKWKLPQQPKISTRVAWILVTVATLMVGLLGLAIGELSTGP
jgi:hypothetical protein